MPRALTDDTFDPPGDHVHQLFVPGMLAFYQHRGGCAHGINSFETCSSHGFPALDEIDNTIHAGDRACSFHASTQVIDSCAHSVLPTRLMSINLLPF